MNKKDRIKQIEGVLRNKPAPKKRNLAKRLNISISTLSKYLCIMKKQSKIAYMRSKDDFDCIGSSYIVWRSKGLI